MKGKRIPFLIASFVFLFTGCFNLFEKPSSGSDNPPVDNTITAYTVIEEMELSLESLLTVDQVAVIGTASRARLTEDTEDIENSIDIIAEGAIMSLYGLSLTTIEKQEIIDNILESLLSSINTHRYEIFTAVEARAIDPYAASMSSILQRLSAAAIRNLSNAGLSSEEIADAARNTVSTMVSALDKGGVQAEEVPSVIQVIAQSAVESITNNSNESIVDAVKGITEGAVSAIDSIKVNGFDGSQISEVIGGITSGATKGINSIADDVATENSSDGATAISDLAAAITGSAVKSVDNLNIASSDISKIVKNVTETAIKNVSALTVSGVDTTSDNAITQNIIKNITSSSSTEAVNLTKLDSNDKTEVLKAVVSGAADGAQSISSTLDNVKLGTIITIDEDGDGTGYQIDEISDSILKAALVEGVDKGIAAATNNPPIADSGENLTEEAWTEVSLDGSASSEPDEGDSIVEYHWFISSKPANSTDSEIIQELLSQPEALFIGDIAGDYVLGLRVVDSYGDSDTSFLTVTISIPPENELYGGLTAEERLNLAIGLLDDGKPDAALVEINKIFTYYPETDTYAGAYLIKGNCYNNKGMMQEAISAYIAVREQSGASLEDYGYATLQLGWIQQSVWDDYEDDLTAAQAYFTELNNTDTYGGTRFIGDALHGLGFNQMVTEKPGNAMTLYQQALDYENTALGEKFWIKYHMGETFFWDSDDSNDDDCLTHWIAISDDPDTYCKNNNGSTNYGNIYRVNIDIADRYGMKGDVTTGLVYMDRIFNTSGMPDNYLANASQDLANYYRDTGNSLVNQGDVSGAIEAYDEAEDYYNDAWDYNPSVAWPLNDLCWMYRDWMRLLSDGTEKSSIETLYFAALTEGIASEHIQATVHMLLNRAGYYMWDKDLSDFTAAKADLDTALSRASNNGLNDKAWVLMDLANYHRHMGWEHHEETNFNWKGEFYTAIDLYKQVTPENYPNLDEWMTKFFFEAKIQMAECYSGLKNYDLALSYLQNALLNIDGEFSDTHLAYIRLAIADNYWEKARNDRDSGYYNGAISTLAAAMPYLDEALSSVSESSFENNYDFNEFLNKAYRLLGEVNKETGWIYLDDKDDFSSAEPFLTKAIEEFEKLSDNGNWEYYDALRSISDCYTGLRDYEGARTSLENTLAIVDSYNSDDRPWLLIDIAETYWRQLEDLFYHQGTWNATEVEQILSDGLIAYTDIESDPSLGSEHLAEIFSQKGRMLQACANELYSSDLSQITEYEDLMDQSNTAFSNILDTDLISDDFDEYHSLKADAYREIGNNQRDEAHSYGNCYEWNSDNGYSVSVFRTYLTDALDNFDEAVSVGSTGNVDDWVFNNSKSQYFRACLDLIYSYEEPESNISAFSDYLTQAITYGEEVLAWSDIETDEAVDMICQFGELNTLLRGQTIGSTDFSLNEAVTWYSIVLSEFGGLETHFMVEAYRGLALAYKADANDEMEKVEPDYTAAIDSYEISIDYWNTILSDYSSIPSDYDWLIENAQWENENTYFSYGECLYDSGDKESALDAFTEVVNMDLDRKDEAQTWVDQINTELGN